MTGEVLEKLMKIIEDRQMHPKDDSYTCSLFRRGVPKIGEKILEEAEEVVDAAKSEGKQRTIYELADLFYHVMVLMGYHGISLEEVERELESRMK